MMSAVIRQDWRKKTYRELYIMYQAVLLETWDHTVRILGAWTDKKVPFETLHPYRSKDVTSTTASVSIPTRSIMQIEEYRDGERVSILKHMYHGEEDLQPDRRSHTD